MSEIENERQMIRDAAVKTAQRLVKPKAEEIDTAKEFPRELLEAFGRQGLLSVIVPEDFGGTNGDIFSFCYVVEEIAKVCGSSALILLAQGVGSMPILIGGDASQQERYFTQIAEKNSLVAFALSEADPGAESRSVRMRAEKVGGDYVLSGRECSIANGSIADLYSVFAVTQPGQEAAGISAFVVEQGAPGLSFGKRDGTIGMRGVVTTDLIFENCRVPAVSRLGEENKGWEIARKTLNVQGITSGALAVGISQGALDFSMNYAGERVQFGKTIASFQAIRFMIADMATLVEAARALVYKAAVHLESQREDVERLSAAAKTYASDVAMKVTTDAVQILGGYGYMRDYPVERMMRDAKVVQVYGRTNQIQRMVIAHDLFND
jgi:alkylation response protein AidB-like acyl-CoA dehydrogenase